VKANKIDSELAFNWWVPVVMHQKMQLIASAMSWHQHAGYKFGI